METSSKKRQTEQQFILTENLWRVLVQLSWPAVVAMILFGLNTVFDAYFVGQFVGENALAGISLAYPLTQLISGIASLIGVGAGSALSIAIGAQDDRTQTRLLGNVNFLILVFSLVATIIGFVFATPIIQLMGGSGPALVEGTNYFKIIMLGTFFNIAGLSGNMIIRGEGRMKMAALMMGVGLLVNIVCNYLFIVILDYGVKGAAWGTNVGMVAYAFVAYYYFAKGKASFKTKAFGLYTDVPILKDIASMGLSSFIITVMNTIQAVIILNTITSLAGSQQVAFFGVTFRLFGFISTPILGLMRALQPVVGINYGAQQYERVFQSFKRFALISGILIVPFWLLLLVMPEFFLTLMLPDTIFLASDILNFRIYMSLLPTMSILFMSMTYFPAVNQGKMASILGIIRQVLLYIPFMLIVPRLFGLNWVYYGSALIDGSLILVCGFLVKRSFDGMRKRTKEKLQTP